MTKRVSNDDLELVGTVAGAAGTLLVTVRETRGYDAWPGGRVPYQRMAALAKTQLTARPGSGLQVKLWRGDAYIQGGHAYAVYTVWLEEDYSRL
jgi:hypothetical protein